MLNCITNILGSLDKKIEINQKKIAKLEELAKLIYDYWFVQFGELFFYIIKTIVIDNLVNNIFLIAPNDHRPKIAYVLIKTSLVILSNFSLLKD